MTQGNMANNLLYDRSDHPSEIKTGVAPAQQQKSRRSNGVRRTNTVTGVTDQARKVLEELLTRDTEERQLIKKESPFSAPTPHQSRGNGMFHGATSPVSDPERDRVNGSYKRKPGNGIRPGFDESSPSPVDDDKKAKRKKKSLFVRTKERLRETMRREVTKDQGTTSDSKTEPVTSSGKGQKKKNFWQISFLKKDEKKSKSQKRHTDGSNRHDKGDTENDRFSDSEILPAASRNSLPSDVLRSTGEKKVTTTTRCRSADETRLLQRPEDEAKLLKYFPPRNVVDTDRCAGTLPARYQGQEILRRNLDLPGLVPNYLNHHHAAPLAVAEDSRITSDDDDEEDEDTIDGPLPEGDASQSGTSGVVLLRSSVEQSWIKSPLLHATAKPFSEKTKEERNELFSRIAQELDAIGDNYNFGSSAKLSKGKDSGTMQPNGNSEMTRTSSTSSLADISNVVGDLLRNTTYDTFQQVVNRTIGSEPGIEQIAAMFRLTKWAVNQAGLTSQRAANIKDMAIRYFHDHFANWMADEGGWESVVEETDDMELD